MNIPSPTSHHSLYYRLIALWVVCEAFAGGILHAIKLPFTGMLVSSLSVMCIILIAWYIPGKAAILKAMLIVTFFKLTLSPHSPPTAYIAVAFQGGLGYFLFRRKTNFTLKGILLGCIALAESAAQRVFVLWLVYGMSFWKAIDEYIRKITGSASDGSFSAYLAIGYILLHAMAGMLMGYAAVKIAKHSTGWTNDPALQLAYVPETSPGSQLLKKRKSRIVKFLFIIILLTILAVSIIYPAYSILTSKNVLAIIARVILVAGSWYFFVSPMIMKFIRHFLKKKSEKLQMHIEETGNIIPYITRIFSAALQASKKFKGKARLKFFIKILVTNILVPLKTIE